MAKRGRPSLKKLKRDLKVEKDTKNKKKEKQMQENLQL